MGCSHIHFSFQAVRNIRRLPWDDAHKGNQLSVDYSIVCDSVLYDNIREYLNENSVSIGFEKEIDSDNYAYTICNAGTHFGRILYAFAEPSISADKNVFHTKDNFERVKAPLEGVFQSSKAINELIHEKEEICKKPGSPFIYYVWGR